MNGPTPTRLRTTVHDTVQLNRAFVAAGVTRFAGQTLSVPSTLIEHLSRTAPPLHELTGTAPDDWPGACAALARLATRLTGPWGLVMRDSRLQLHEWFALALAGECESSHALTLALTELQAPSGSARPSLHLLAAMSEMLFGAELAPIDWPNHALVRQGLVMLMGDGAGPARSEVWSLRTADAAVDDGHSEGMSLLTLPGCTLGVPPRLWALLCGDTRLWPGLTTLDDAADITLPAATSQRLQVLLPLLRAGQVRVLVVRSTPLNGLAVAAQLATQLGLVAVAPRLADWQRSPALATACRHAGWLPVLSPRLGPGESYTPDLQALGLTPLIVVAGQDGSIDAPGSADIQVPPLSRAERQQAWRHALGPDARGPLALGPDAPTELADHALVDGPTIRALAARMRQQVGAPAGATHDPGPEPSALQRLRRARTGHGAERLNQLAQPVLREVGADALVLPAAAQAQFDRLLRRCQMREQLWTGLGPSLAAPSTGVRALFAGDSGAGKTLAASHLATLVGAPLYRVDLAAVMNKYVGETEKNLGRLLDEAAALDAMLLIDEADALFGRRSDAGKDNGERYADMMTNFLLTRIESHAGLVVLTTNTRSRLDSAFNRRFDVIIDFPQPGVDERQRLWQAHLGARSPGDEACRLLAAYSDLVGGHIRNAVIHAAACDSSAPGQPLGLGAIVAALIDEYRKLGRTPPAQLHQIVG